MVTNNVAFKFSPYLLPIIVQELLSNLDSTLPIFFSYNAHNLGRLLGITDDFETIPFHLVLFLAALVELANFIPVRPLILPFHLFFFFLLLCSVGLSLLNKKTFRRRKTPSCLFFEEAAWILLQTWSL